MSFVSFRESLAVFLHSRKIELLIIFVIIINSIALGLETNKVLMGSYGYYINLVDEVCITIFVIEILLKIFANGLRYFKDPWHIFDVVIVSIALVPATEIMSVVRSLRILRILRLVSTMPRLKRVVESMLTSIPNIIGVIAIMMVIFYCYAVVGVHLYGETFPKMFGTIGSTFFTLFQAMTLESWASGIANPIMKTHPEAWIYFVSFIALTSLVVLNLVVSLLIDGIQSLRNKERDIVAQKSRKIIQDHLIEAIELVGSEVKDLKKYIKKNQ